MHLVLVESAHGMHPHQCTPCVHAICTVETHEDKLQGTHKMSFAMQLLFLSGLAYIYVHYVHYYSKPNNTQILVCVKQKFVLTRF